VGAEKIAESSSKAVNNWYQRYKQEMLNEALTCSNISLLTIKFLEPCNLYFNNPDALQEKWTKKFTEPQDG